MAMGKIKHLKCDIWGSHSIDVEDSSPLGCYILGNNNPQNILSLNQQLWKFQSTIQHTPKKGSHKRPDFSHLLAHFNISPLSSAWFIINERNW